MLLLKSATFRRGGGLLCMLPVKAKYSRMVVVQFENRTGDWEGAPDFSRGRAGFSRLEESDFPPFCLGGL
jgi:hypothetical protein